jgi:dihydrolipoamide dehydrogenase
MADTEHYDLVVIGAGPGGYVAAIRAAQLGMRVLCVEREPALGGTCLRIGCIPSKALLDSSERFWQARTHLAAHGVGVGEVSLDLPAMMRRKDQVVQGLTSGVAGLFKKNRITRRHGTARIAAPDRVTIEGPDSGTVGATRILIATGSVPAALPGFELDGTRLVGSEEALAFDAVPARLLVIGAGAVGLELGSVWARLGCEVRVVEVADRIVPGMDGDLTRALQRALEKQGLSFRLSTAARKAVVKEATVEVTIEADGAAVTETFDRVLVAVGRRPVTAGLGLEALGVALDPKGHIRVDERFETSVPGIHAVGDVIGGPMLAHKAEEEGIACVERIAGQAGHVNYEAIPNVVYTWPELASVGKTEEQLKEEGRAYKVGKFPFSANSRAKVNHETDGFAKVLADEKTDEILGVHLVGPSVSEMIAEYCVAMEFAASAEDVALTCHPHPTRSEALRQAAMAVGGHTTQA